MRYLLLASCRALLLGVVREAGEAVTGINCAALKVVNLLGFIMSGEGVHCGRGYTGDMTVIVVDMVCVGAGR
jgi:hypothetical protein